MGVRTVQKFMAGMKTNDGKTGSIAGQAMSLRQRTRKVSISTYSKPANTAVRGSQAARTIELRLNAYGALISGRSTALRMGRIAARSVLDYGERVRFNVNRDDDRRPDAPARMWILA